MLVPANISSGGADVTIGVEEKIGTVTVNGTTYGKYRKVVNFGLIPNTNVKTVAHGISGAVGFLSVSGVAFRSDGVCRPMPVAVLSNATSGTVQLINLYVNNTYVYVETNDNFSTFTSSYVTIEYYK